MRWNSLQQINFLRSDTCTDHEIYSGEIKLMSVVSKKKVESCKVYISENFQKIRKNQNKMNVRIQII